MPSPRFFPSRSTALRLAALLACSTCTWVQADGGDETLGVVSSVQLPSQAQGKPPSWAGKAFRQGVVADPFDHQWLLQKRIPTPGRMLTGRFEVGESALDMRVRPPSRRDRGY